VNDLSARALLTLQEARRFVYRDENDGSRDDILTDAVNDVSDSIWDHCEREFKDTTASPGPDARIFAMNAAGWIDLAPYDLRAVTSVKLACKEWVSNICQNPAAFASAAMGGYAVSPEIDFSPSARAGMPPAVRYRLKRYCRSI